MQEILQQLSLGNFQKPKCTASDFHARLSQLLESEEVLKIQEALSFLRSCGWLKSDTLIFFSPKMLKGFSTTITEELSEQSSEQWMSWGTMQNGKYVTANTSGHPKTEKESLLSDILEGGGCRRKILPLDTSYTKVDELSRYADCSNTITSPGREAHGVYPFVGGGGISEITASTNPMGGGTNRRVQIRQGVRKTQLNGSSDSSSAEPTDSYFRGVLYAGTMISKKPYIQNYVGTLDTKQGAIPGFHANYVIEYDKGHPKTQ